MNELSMVDDRKIKLEIYDIIEKLPLNELMELLNRLKKLDARKSKRSDVDIEVIFSVKGVEYRGVANSISFEGLFILTEMVFDVGDDINVRIADVNIKDDSTVKGKIIRTSEDGFGVQLIRR